MIRAIFAIGCIHALAASSASADPQLASKAVTAEVIGAVVGEMKRQATELQISGQPKPYYLAYKITEIELNECAATLGHTTTARPRHFVTLEARVRVSPDNTPAFDNGNFVVRGDELADGVSSIELPLVASPYLARRAVWMTTDAAYKKALVQLQAKLEHRSANQTDAGTAPPSWTSETPVVSDRPVLVPALERLDEMESRATAVSAAFRDQPLIRESRVALTSYIMRRWLVTTEGTSVADARRMSGVVIAASGQAPDGQALPLYFVRYGHTGADLPTDDELGREAKHIIETIRQLRAAPVIEQYAGPVLFEGEGATGLIRSTLAPHLGGTPVPEGMDPIDAKYIRSALDDAVGARVLSANLSIVDDPTTSVGAGVSLIGGYKTDDEAVLGQRVVVIEDGVLKARLTSRTPADRTSRSNGHARLTSDGGALRGAASNLFVTGRRGVTRRALEKLLVAKARASGKKYGVLITKFDDAAITAAPDFSRRELVQLIKTTDQALPPPALLAYRVYLDGKRELVRGATLAEVPLRAWKSVLGVSTELTAQNYLVANESQLQLRLVGGDEGLVPLLGIEAAIVTPDLLFEDLEVFGAKIERPLPLVRKPAIE